MHSLLYDLNTTRANHSPRCAKRTTPANRLNASSTSFSGSKLNEARTYGVGLPDMKNEVPGSARTPASIAFWRMRASESPSGAPSDGGRSNLNLEQRIRKELESDTRAKYRGKQHTNRTCQLQVVSILLIH